MKKISLVLLASLSIGGCNHHPADSVSQQQKESPVSAVTFRSHLSGTIDGDPQIETGQKIRVVADAIEPMANHDSILIQLPNETPYTGDAEQYYLRGFAIGQLSAHNTQFL